ncbi:hypothetical protein AAZX31_08G203500 [Glycine max]
MLKLITTHFLQNRPSSVTLYTNFERQLMKFKKYSYASWDGRQFLGGQKTAAACNFLLFYK